jgi:RNA recognition motif-containing protein
LIEFKDAEAVDTALILNGTELLGRVIQILPSESAEAVPTSADDALAAPPPPTDLAAAGMQLPILPLPTGAPGMLTPQMMMMMMPGGVPFMLPPPGPPPVGPPAATAAAVAAAAAAATVPTGPNGQPLKNTEMSNQQTPEELNRTVYVGNIAPSVTTIDLARHMGSCGPVTFTRISGGTGNAADPSRYAFVEYATVEASRTAVERLNSSSLAGAALRVSSAKNPIVKPALPAELLPTSEARRALREKLRRLETRLKSANDDNNITNGNGQINDTNNDDNRQRDRSRSPLRR